MNQILTSVLIVFLFFVLTPGVYLTIPRRGSKWTVALVHGVLFALVLYIANNFIFKVYEGFDTVCGIGKPPCPTGYSCQGSKCTKALTCEQGGTLNLGCKCCMKSVVATCPSGQTNNSGFCYKANDLAIEKNKIGPASCYTLGSTRASNGACTIRYSPSCTGGNGIFDETSMKCIA